MQQYVAVSVSNSEKKPDASPTVLTQPCASDVQWTLTVSWDGLRCKAWRSASLPFIMGTSRSSKEPKLVVPLRRQEAFLLEVTGQGKSPPNPPNRPNEAIGAGVVVEIDLGYQFVLQGL